MGHRSMPARVRHFRASVHRQSRFTSKAGHPASHAFAAMSDTAAALEQRALECERKAALTTEEAQRRMFLEIAKAWRAMAADYQELSRKGATAAARPSGPQGEPP